MKIIQAVAISALLVALSSYAWCAEGLIVMKSPHSPKDTMDRLETLLKKNNMTIFARIDHAAGAAKVGKKLRSTELLIFGNPQGGTPFMECSQTVGIDLPLKALVWEDASTSMARLQRSVILGESPRGYAVSCCGKHKESPRRIRSRSRRSVS